MLISIEDMTSGRVHSAEMNHAAITQLMDMYHDDQQPPTEDEVLHAVSHICGCLWQRDGHIRDEELGEAIQAALFYLLNSYPPICFQANTMSATMAVQYDEQGACTMCAAKFTVSPSEEVIH